jgi:transposase
MVIARANRPIYGKVIELHQQGLSSRKIMATIENSPSIDTICRWIREWKAKQEQQQAS